MSGIKSMTKKIAVCKTNDVAPGRQRIVTVGKYSIGVFNVEGSYFAVLNYGRNDGLVRCAWHGWEFDIRTGQCLGAPAVKAKTFSTSVEDGEVFVHI